MPKVSGSLKLVTGSPAAVSQVWLRAPHGRTQSGAYVTEAPDTIQVTGGAVSFDVLPGPLVMTLVSHGAPIHTVKLLVPDKSTATLAECIEAAELATDGTLNALERLALEVQAELGQVPSLVSTALAQDSTIIDAVQQASALRVDTTVGTRVFFGNRMIYGDTGWRNITSLIPEVTSGTVRVRRINEVSYISFSSTVFSTTSAGLNISRMIPAGFRIADTGFTYFPFSPDVSPQPTTLRIDQYGHAYLYNVRGTTTSGMFSWPASSWPTTLPGTPA